MEPIYDTTCVNGKWFMKRVGEKGTGKFKPDYWKPGPDDVHQDSGIQVMNEGGYDKDSPQDLAKCGSDCNQKISELNKK